MHALLTEFLNPYQWEVVVTTASGTKYRVRKDGDAYFIDKHQTVDKRTFWQAVDDKDDPLLPDVFTLAVDAIREA